MSSRSTGAFDRAPVAGLFRTVGASDEPSQTDERKIFGQAARDRVTFNIGCGKRDISHGGPQAGGIQVVAVTVERLDGKEPLRIEHAELVAEVFFRLDASARPGGYDEYIAAAPADQANRLVADDIGAINRTFRARSPIDAWQELLVAGDLPSLAALQPGWDLLSMGDAEWTSNGCADRLTEAIQAMSGWYRRRAVVTKVLHLKRPRLIPICDSLVEAQVGAPASIGTVELIEHIRRQGRANLGGLEEIREILGRQGIQRSLVRVFDALLWSTHPASELAAVPELLAGWQARGLLTVPGPG